MNDLNELLKLKELLDSGLITESDFKKKKEELFNKQNNEVSIEKIEMPSDEKIDYTEKFSQSYIPENSNKNYFIIAGVVLVLIVAIIFFNRNSETKTQVKPDNRIMEVRLPPKENISPVVDTNNNKSISDTVSLIQSSDGFRDPRAKDYANVYFDSKYTLFDLETDEPIFPDQNGVYEIWYSSNENPVPNSKRLSIKELESFTFYKFKNQVNCEEWCRKKQQRN